METLCEFPTGYVDIYIRMLSSDPVFWVIIRSMDYVAWINDKMRCCHATAANGRGAECRTGVVPLSGPGMRPFSKHMTHAHVTTWLVPMHMLRSCSDDIISRYDTKKWVIFVFNWFIFISQFSSLRKKIRWKTFEKLKNAFSQSITWSVHAHWGLEFH